MAASCRLAVVTGTDDICRPLFHALHERFGALVAMVPEETAYDELAAMRRRDPSSWMLVSHERTLNALSERCRQGPGGAALMDALPASATVRGVCCHAAELSDKARWQRLIDPIDFSHFRRIRSAALTCAEIRRGVHPPFPLPLVVKPARKDVQDSFTRQNPGKMIHVGSREAWSFVKGAVSLWPDDFELVVQEWVEGETVTWGGAIRGGAARGYQFKAVQKSPAGRPGGTTTLARVDRPDSLLAAAVAEMASSMRMEGIFEIEFIRSNGVLYHFYEVNPRPWLQISAVLRLEADPIGKYFEDCGLPMVRKARLRPPPVLWGSAHRYRSLNLAGATSRRVFLRTLLHDVRLGPGYSASQRMRYLVRMLRELTSGASVSCRADPASPPAE